MKKINLGNERFTDKVNISFEKDYDKLDMFVCVIRTPTEMEICEENNALYIERENFLKKGNNIYTVKVNDLKIGESFYTLHSKYLGYRYE